MLYLGFAADFTLVLSFLVLLYKFLKTKSAAGVSGKMLTLYAISFYLQYNDFIIRSGSAYNFTVKMLTISMSFYFVYLIYIPLKETYQKEFDICRMDLLLAPCALLAFVLNKGFTPYGIIYSFGVYLEAIAILPQLLLMTEAGKSETYIIPYILLMGFNNAFYTANLIYISSVDEYFQGLIPLYSGLVQVCFLLTGLILYATDKTEMKNYSDKLLECVLDKLTLNVPTGVTVGSKPSKGDPTDLEKLPHEESLTDKTEMNYSEKLLECILDKSTLDVPTGVIVGSKPSEGDPTDLEKLHHEEALKG